MWKKPLESVDASTEGTPSTTHAQGAPTSTSPTPSTKKITSAGSDAGINTPPELNGQKPQRGLFLDIQVEDSSRLLQ
jgi:hypothetical protein